MLKKRCDCGRGLELAQRDAAWRACSDVWHYEFKAHGEEQRGSTRTASEREAAKIERAERARLEALPPPCREGRNVTLSALAGEDVKRGITENPSSSTIALEIENHWKPVIRLMGDMRARDVTTDTAHQYIQRRRAERLRKHPVAGQTINRELGAWHRGLEIAERKRWISAAPKDWPELEHDALDEKRRGHEHPPEILVEWMQELTHDAREEAVCCALINLRSEELKRVEADWLEYSPGTETPAIFRLLSRGTKGKERVVGVPALALEIIERRIAANPGAKLIFCQESHVTTERAASRRIYDRAVEQLVATGLTMAQAERQAKTAGYGKRIKPRDLRAGWATVALIHTGGDLGAVQGAMGHSNPSTTAKYLKTNVQRATKAAAAVARGLGDHLAHAIAAPRRGRRGHKVGGTDDMKSDVSGGERGRNRTDSQWIKSPQLETFRHLSTCFYCQQVVLACIEKQADPGAGGHSEGAHADAAKGGVA